MSLLRFFLSLAVLYRRHQLPVDNYIVHIEKNTLVSVKSTHESTGSLDLSGLSIGEIDVNCFAEADDIKSLNLANNKLSKLPYMVFRYLPDLEDLSLANNSLRYVQYAFWGLPFLRTLDISNNSIDHLSDGSLYGLTNATDISIDGNGFGKVESQHFMEPFTMLSVCMIDGIVQSLDVFNVANEQEYAKRNCTTLYRPLMHNAVVLSSEGIKGFEKNWYRLHRLNVTSLDLQLNSIEIVTDELLNDLPANLTEVKLAWNKIRILRKGIIRNRHLLKLDLSENQIDEIEDYALGETRLTDLVMRGNELRNLRFVETLPPTLSSLTLPGTKRLAECRMEL